MTGTQVDPGRRTGVRRLLAALVLAVAASATLLVLVPDPAFAADRLPASGSAPESATPEQELADRYAPVVMVRRYDELCGDDGEPYVPMTVDALLGNPEVALRQVGNDDAVIRWAPTGADLYGRGAGVYLDLPGDSLDPGCIYAEYSAQYTPSEKSAVYAHVATEAGRPGYLALQYWLYWYYNDWNDRHEGDWEFIQVMFRADDAAGALETDPVSVGYAQHEGGETHDWNSPALERDGDHPVVYSSQGSHASYFAPALYLGRGASEGFGCDDTQGPSTRLDPAVVLLPDSVGSSSDPHAWLTYQGRWGERQSGPNNGPEGPFQKDRWSQPISWADDLRASSLEIPGGSAAPPAVIGSFCTVVAAGSQVYFRASESPGWVLTGVVALALLVVFAARRTSWSRVPVLPLVTARRAGQIMRAAASVYRRNPLPFLATGLLALPVGLAGVLTAALLSSIPTLGSAVEVATNRGDPVGRAMIASWIGAGLWPVTVLLVSAAVSYLMAEVEREDRGQAWTLGVAWRSIREVGRRLRDLTRAYVLIALAILLLSLSVVGLPLAVWLGVRYQFVGQVVMLEARSARDALHRSSRLVRRRWWHTAMFAVIVWSGVHVLGATIGLLLLVAATGLPLWSISLVTAFVGVALIPLGAIALTLLYGDAVAEKDRIARADGSPATAV